MKTYFWRNEQVETLNRMVYAEDFAQCSMLKYLYCHCVQLTEEGRTYFGFFDQTYRVSWTPSSIKEFSPEFQTYLLLLGIS